MPAKVTSILDRNGEQLLELGTVGTVANENFVLHIAAGIPKVLVTMNIAGTNMPTLRFITENAAAADIEFEFRITRASTGYVNGFNVFVNGTFGAAYSGLAYFHESHIYHVIRARKPSSSSSLSLSFIQDGPIPRYPKRNAYSWTSNLNIYGPQPAESYIRGISQFGPGHGASSPSHGIPSDGQNFTVYGDNGGSPFSATFEFDIDSMFGGNQISIVGLTTMEQVLSATANAINSVLAGYVTCVIDSGCLRLRTTNTGSTTNLFVDVNTTSALGWYWAAGTYVYGSDGTSWDQYMMLPFGDSNDLSQIREIRVNVIRGTSGTIRIVDSASITSTKLVSPTDNSTHVFGVGFGQSDHLFAANVMGILSPATNRYFNVFVEGDPSFTGNFTVYVNGISYNTYSVI